MAGTLLHEADELDHLQRYLISHPSMQPFHFQSRLLSDVPPSEYLL